MEGTRTAYVRCDRTLKYLGVVLDPRLSWIPHLEYLRTDIITFYDRLKQFSRATWGLSPNILKLIYLQAIEKKIIYGASVWYKNKVKINQKLLTIQRIPLLNITKCYSTTSTEALQILAGVIPIDLKIRATISIKRHTWSPEEFNDSDYQTDELKNYIPYSVPVYDPTKLKIVSRGFGSPRGVGYEFYTDGSKKQVTNESTGANEDRVGCGFLVKLDNHTIYEQTARLNNECSIYSAELTAIKLATLWANNNNIEQYTIFSDSKSSLQALENPTPTDPLVEEIKAIVQNKQCLFNWIKAHSGEPGNEEADILAKKGTLLDGVDFHYTITKPQVKHRQRQVSRILWQDRWSSSANGRHTHYLIPTVNECFLSSDFYFNQFLTSHGVFGDHQARMFQKSSACKYCGHYQTIKHLMLDCQKFATIRGNSFDRRGDIRSWCRTNKQRQIIKNIIKRTLEDALAPDDILDPLYTN
ncbi:uncharacterized protein [Parasteatoda tepidariorum]|uniref:uncharacterized protein n=1 Tax=Parasteatoda tepidariorum TaxID=114398 RepID=UPI001C71BB4F|nr:uncharacterized protein LOC122271527 [Parasteatoda tepidariorum]